MGLVAKQAGGAVSRHLFSLSRCVHVYLCLLLSAKSADKSFSSFCSLYSRVYPHTL